MTIASPDQPTLELLQALEPRASHRLIKHLFEYCHAMATAYVRLKSANGPLHLDRIGLNSNDFAIDAIADIFRRNGNNEYPVLLALKRRLETADTTFPNELRRLVLGAVTQHIHHSIRHTDPDLARLLRNIKFTLRNHASARSIRVSERLWIAPKQNDLLHHLPVIADELLNMEFWNSASASSTLREQLSVLSQILHHQSLYRREYPVTAFARIILDVYRQKATVDDAVDQESQMFEDDVKTLVETVVAESSKNHLASYYSHGKLSEAEVVAFERSMRDILLESFVSGNGDSETYSDILRTHIPGLTSDHYNRQYRTKLEYVAKRAKEALKMAAKREFEISVRR